MNSQQLQQRLEEIKSHIDSFKEELLDAERSYQRTLELTTDPELRSSLMEYHIINTERQRVAMAQMERLYDQVREGTGGLGESNL